MASSTWVVDRVIVSHDSVRHDPVNTTPDMTSAMTPLPSQYNRCRRRLFVSGAAVLASYCLSLSDRQMTSSPSLSFKIPVSTLKVTASSGSITWTSSQTRSDIHLLNLDGPRQQDVATTSSRRHLIHRTNEIATRMFSKHSNH
jgi:hypothetical protein